MGTLQRADMLEALLIGGPNDGQRMVVPDWMECIEVATPAPPFDVADMASPVNATIPINRYVKQCFGMSLPGRHAGFYVFLYGERIDQIDIVQMLLDGYRRPVE